MSVLYYVGKAAAAGRNVERRLTATAKLDEGISRSWVSGRVAEQAALKATKTYTDTRDSQFALASYFSNQDALLLPSAQKGVPNGVATLNVSGKIPAAQVPFLGSGILRGPHGLETTVVTGGSTDSTPVNIADLYTGVTGITGMLWPYMIVGVQATGGRPVVEVRVGNSTQTDYADQVLIAAGRGREYYNSPQILAVIPVPRTTGMNNTGSFGPATSLLVQAWMYNDGAAGSTVAIASGQIFSSALFFAKTAT